MAGADRPRVLITGAAGAVGQNLWKGWEEAGCYDLTLTDARPIQDSASRVEIGDIADRDLVCRLCEGQDVLVHLAYIPYKPLADVTDIGVAMQLFEAASAAGVKRIIYASSNAAIGMNEYQIRPPRFSTGDQFRPGGWYGAQKCMAEMAGRYLSSYEGIRFISIRIGTFTGGSEPVDLRQCTTLLTPRDGLQLFTRAIDYDGPVKCLITYGTSGNHSGHQVGFLDISEAVEILGYEPQDNMIRDHAHRFAD
ncbi:MAG: NAD(P)-dependent oxidoreductase [Gemmatimonadetes bacterium]|jgi:uronate dehydrogenase|nr:NAD(P)-dependent oxidoreductase [Gemmatimonadota bacterium]MBT6150247.1 NAD(P)-dependent oxidoreductase [Gemmatimonadota bacterium]MBT7864651.1 NAD(P)-dependent oxidoreductase [Gemmatimonadota bacterium]